MLVAACFFRFGLSAEAALAAFFCAALVALSAIDVERRILPDLIVLPSFLVVLAVHLALEPGRAVEWVAAALGASALLFAAAVAKPGGMGLGDVKLMLLLGAMLGKLVVVGMMLGFVAALVPSVALLARHGAGARKMTIPFGPFLAFGAVLALFVGDRIWHAYVGTL